MPVARVRGEPVLTLITTPEAPVPEGATVAWIIAADGTRLRAVRWCPEDATRGTVVILNGRTEFIEKYFEVVRNLQARGFAVATLDWRGQGASDRPLPNRQKGHVVDFDLYVSDLQLVIERFILPTCPGPYRAICHSMGGNIGLRYLGTHPDTFASALFTAPMWGIGKPARTSSLMRAVSFVTSLFGLESLYVPGAGRDHDAASFPFEGNTLTTDRDRFERSARQIEAEPLLAVGGPTLGWVTQAVASMDALHAPGFAEAIDIPIRVCTAGDDALVSVAAQTLISRRLPNAVQVLIEDAKHELLMERDHHRDRVLAAFDEL